MNIRHQSATAKGGLLGWMVASFVIHGGFVGGLVYAQTLKPPKLDLSQSMPVELVRLGTQEDSKLLPRREAAPPPPAPEPPVAVPTPAPPAPPPAQDAVALDKPEEKEPPKPPPPKKAKPAKQRKLSRAAERLLRNGSSSDGRLDDALAKLDRVTGSPDGSRYGTGVNPQAAAEGYKKELTAALKAKYEVPAPIPSAQRRFLKATVVLFIDRTGRITKFEFTERHSNKLFMTALEKMLREIELPRPPKSLRRQVAKDGVVVLFTP